MSFLLTGAASTIDFANVSWTALILLCGFGLVGLMYVKVPRHVQTWKHGEHEDFEYVRQLVLTLRALVSSGLVVLPAIIFAVEMGAPNLPGALDELLTRFPDRKAEQVLHIKLTDGSVAAVNRGNGQPVTDHRIFVVHAANDSARRTWFLINDTTAESYALETRYLLRDLSDGVIVPGVLQGGVVMLAVMILLVAAVAFAEVFGNIAREFAARGQQAVQRTA
jgi:hypothetical protein